MGKCFSKPSGTSVGGADVTQATGPEKPPAAQHSLKSVLIPPPERQKSTIPVAQVREILDNLHASGGQTVEPSAKNPSGMKVTEMISYLSQTRFKSQLPSRFEPICRVMKQMCKANFATITFATHNHETGELCGWIVGSEDGNTEGEYFGWEDSPTKAMFDANMRDVLWVEDALNHPVYGPHPTTIKHGFRLMALAPLWASDGSFVGAVGVTDTKPHPYNAAEAVMLMGLADVVLRDIEHFYVISKAEEAIPSEDEEALQRPDDEINQLELGSNLRESVLVIDRGWTILYGNVTWESMTGYNKQQTEGMSFWTFFKEVMGVSEDNLGFLTDDTPPFTLEGYLQNSEKLLMPCKAKFVSVVKDREEAEAKTAEIKLTEGPRGRRFSITLNGVNRPNILKTTVSSNGSNDSAKNASTWTVTITLDKPGSSSSNSAGSQASRVSLDNTGIKVGDITLKYRIGQGGFGVVFAGSRPNGKIVAVKLTQRAAIDVQVAANQKPLTMCADDETGPKSTAQNFKDPFLEALLSVTLNHPNLVRSYEYVLTKEGEDVLGTVEGLVRGAPSSKLITGKPSHSPQSVLSGGPGQSVAAGSFVWLVQEYCDLGTLDRASIAGSYLVTREESMLLTLSTLYDIAQGIHHLHTRNLIHGDLTGNNVLLMSADPPVNGKAYIAKVSDFGLTRLAGKKTREGYSTSILTSTFGTIIYMPPELVCDGVMNSRTDSYSFGSLIYLMLMGKRPFSDFREHQLLLRFVSKPEYMLEFPAEFQCEAELLQLAKDCLQSNYKARPSSQQLIDRIEALWEMSGLRARIGPLTVPPFDEVRAPTPVQP